MGWLGEAEGFGRRRAGQLAARRNIGGPSSEKEARFFGGKVLPKDARQETYCGDKALR